MADALIKCGINKNKSDDAVGKMEGHHDFVNTDKKYNRCKHLGNNDESQKRGLSFEFSFWTGHKQPEFRKAWPERVEPPAITMEFTM